MRVPAPDGTMRKTDQSESAKKLEYVCPLVANIIKDICTAYIFDGMVLRQGMKKSSFNTFKDIAQDVLMQFMRVFNSELGVKNFELILDRLDVKKILKARER